MGCGSSVEGTTFHEENDILSNSDQEALSNLAPIPEEDRNNFVYELATIVLAAFRRNLDEYQKHPDFAVDETMDWAPWMDSIVAPLKREFNPMVARMKPYMERERTKTTFLISREKIQELGLTYFPKHEEAMNMDGLLREAEIEDMRMKLCREANRGIHTQFISHKWAGNQPDTDDHALFEMTKSAAHYIWFDYTCVPQEDHTHRLKHLLAIANICEEATVVPAHANDELEHAYDRSVWCQLEAALLTWDTTNFDPDTQEWTIYDWNDLYAVLPGFLDLWVNADKNWRFFDGKNGYTRTTMILSLLEAFLSHHNRSKNKHPPMVGTDDD